MSKYEATVMDAIKKLEEKLDEEMDTTEDTPTTPSIPTAKKPDGLIGKIKTTLGIS